MSESMDKKVTSSKEKGYAEKGSKEPNHTAQAIITGMTIAAHLNKGSSKS
ncbi:hypothetical protein [Planktothrix sp. FACHB-1365]|nr:hypothetical protein [Planktothrix sp. FACHB-1365]MBD2483064.1 hypothetical protein [Planktothrix sp. FACHB-1365]